jgi:hypothetical protein
MKIYDVSAKEKPRWHQVRWRLSNIFVRIAKKIYPENPEVMAFFIKQMTDLAIYGGSITHIDYKDFANKSFKKDAAKNRRTS